MKKIAAYLASVFSFGKSFIFQPNILSRNVYFQQSKSRRIISKDHKQVVLKRKQGDIGK
ncbi:MAG: hypothetical protein NTX85_01695 [Candidatus Nomurabacteria bacterium]|nr:hypothetical protein [Candidatus Nomurabacteria bacterium]